LEVPEGNSYESQNKEEVRGGELQARLSGHPAVVGSVKRGVKAEGLGPQEPCDDIQEKEKKKVTHPNNNY